MARRVANSTPPTPAIARRVAAALAEWFEREGRRFPWRARSFPAWRLLVSEILLQKTRAPSVAAFLPGFFSTYPTLARLAAARPKSLERAFASLGLQRKRAQQVSGLTRALRARGGSVPRTRAGLEELPGVGPYVSAAYLSTRFGEPVPMVDANFARIVERAFGPRHKADLRSDPFVPDVATRIVSAAEDPRVVNWAVMDLGALVCVPRAPKCADCPIRRYCLTGRS